MLHITYIDAHVEAHVNTVHLHSREEDEEDAGLDSWLQHALGLYTAKSLVDTPRLL